MKIVSFGAPFVNCLIVNFRKNKRRRTASGELLCLFRETGDGSDAVTYRVHVPAGNVYRLSAEDGSVLTLADARSGYALRIYRHGDELVEDYAPADAPLDPEEAQVIGPTRLFRAELADGDTLRLATDAGEVLVHLRSEGGGEP